MRKVYQENGNLLRFAEYFKEKDILLADTPNTALIQVLRQLSPVTIVDESHNAGSDLSVEMLSNLNPSFILDLTATPRNNSNIISFTDARELKKENMVKLPVIVYNRNNRQTVIQDALQLQSRIEQQAVEEEQAGGEYIRPIVLFQAQPNINEDSKTFEKIKDILLEMGVPEEQIGIKTSKINTISNQDLMSRDCPIRYIITVNALKEGWDCPFAYILASLANKSSKVDVEQIVGRILRQPYARKHKASLLNTSYVFTNSKDFHSTLDSIIAGLNEAGFSKKDFRVGRVDNALEDFNQVYKQINLSDEENSQDEDEFNDITPEEIKKNLVNYSEAVNDELNEMIREAMTQVNEYTYTLKETEDFEFIEGELGEMMNQNVIQSQFKDDAETLRIPQFFIKGIPDLFGGEFTLLEKENLSEGFSLSEQDTHINFELATGEMYKIDIQTEGEAVPKYKRASKIDSEYLRDYLAKLPPESKISSCTEMIVRIINKNNRYSTFEITEYVKRIISYMNEDELIAMETAIPTYANKILKKIETLEDVYREKQFYKWLDSGKVICRTDDAHYTLPNVITPLDTIDSIPFSLYEGEKNDMNIFERNLIDLIVGLDNILWWHRNIERKGFRLNGFMNHYPDFLVKTKSGKIVLVEAKGDYLDGDDSKSKLKLGRSWQSQAGVDYRYFMVFKEKNFGIQGAYKLDDFIEVMKEL